MSEVKVNKISPRSGTTVTLGDSGDTFTVPSGATFDASNATTTLPSTIVTTTGSQTLTNKTIDVSQLSGTVATSNLGTGTADATTFLRGDQTYASATPAAGSITTTQLAYNPNSFRNIIINGDMSIAQRSTSEASLTSTAYTYPTLDRWFFTRTADCGTWTMSQSTDVPSGYGFAKSLKLDCTATASVSSASTDLRIIQKFEGQNLQYLKYGSANAQSTTLSFWVKSTKTGTFIAELNSKDTRSISKSYTVSVSNTWEYKTITFAGDVSGVIDNDNSEELQVIFWLVAGTTFTSGTLNTSWGSMTNANRAVGQVNIGDNTANDFLITGVQLEAGTTASDFEFLPVDVNLVRCKRYYHQDPVLGGDNGMSFSIAYDTSQAPGGTRYPVTMRASPTITTYNVAGVSGGAHRFGSGDITGVSVIRISATGFTQLSGTFVAGSFYVFLYKADAEL